MKFVTVCNPIAGFEPAPPSSSGRVTFPPEGQIIRLYSSNHNIYGNGYEDYNIFYQGLIS